MRKVLGWISVLAFALAAPAGASPNFLGPTGLLNTPTALTLPQLSYNVFFHGGDFPGGDEFITWGANFGITEAIEVGGSIFDPDPGSNKALLNAKYAFTKDTTSTPGIALGVVDLTDSIDLSIYGVLSKGFGRVPTGGSSGFGLRAHVGFGTGIFDDNIFGGAELLFSDRLSAIAEYDGRDVNFGATFRLGRGVEIKGALFDADELGLGISYSAGLR
jgi:hypothetical protein